jgi:hypothetical protein
MRKERKAAEMELRFSLARVAKAPPIPAEEKSAARATLTKQFRELRRGNPDWFGKKQGTLPNYTMYDMIA